MLGHLRSKALDEFKAALTKALDAGEGFAVAAHDCTQLFMEAFDEGCKGSNFPYFVLYRLYRFFFP